MPVGAAIAGSAIVGAGASYLGSKSAAKTQANAATEAANTQLQAAREAAALQLGFFNTVRGDLAPYRGIGAAAIPGYMALLGLPTPGATSGGTGGTSNAPLTVPGVGGTPASTAPMRAGDVNWAQVLKDRPDVLAEYNKVIAQADKNSPFYTQHGLDKGPEGFAEWWYNNNRPQGDTYTAPQWTQDQIDALYPSSGSSTTGTSTSAPATTGPALDSSGIQTYLENLPGYKFIKDQGIRATTNSLSTKGLGGISGAMAKGISRFVTGLADTTYGEQLDRIARAVGVGQSAANQTGAFGQNATSGAASNLVAGGNAVAGGITGAANANAAGTVGAANAIANGASNAANAYLTSRILSGGGSNPAGIYNI